MALNKGGGRLEITMRDCQRGVHAMRSMDRWQFQRLMGRFENLG